MRKLTVIREKSFVGSMGKVAIYMTDKTDQFMYTIAHSIQPAQIEREKCQFLGILKNNSSLEVEVPETKIAVLAVYEGLGMFMITDHVDIPKGTEDVVLSGKATLAPLKGNPFIFYKK